MNALAKRMVLNFWERKHTSPVRLPHLTGVRVVVVVLDQEWFQNKEDIKEVLFHLITNGVKVTNQPEMVTWSTDTFAVAKDQGKGEDFDDFFKRAYIAKSGMRRDAYKIVAESVS